MFGPLVPVYAGDWLDAKRHGNGTMTFADSSVYVGEWRYDRRHGLGEVKTVDGRVMRGSWFYDKASTFEVPESTLQREAERESKAAVAAAPL